MKELTKVIFCGPGEVCFRRYFTGFGTESAQELDEIAKIPDFIMIDSLCTLLVDKTDK